MIRLSNILNVAAIVISLASVTMSAYWTQQTVRLNRETARLIQEREEQDRRRRATPQWVTQEEFFRDLASHSGSGWRIILDEKEKVKP